MYVGRAMEHGFCRTDTFNYRMFVWRFDILISITWHRKSVYVDNIDNEMISSSKLKKRFWALIETIETKNNIQWVTYCIMIARRKEIPFFLLGVHAALHVVAVKYSSGGGLVLGCSHPMVQAFMREVYSLHIFDRVLEQSVIVYYTCKSNTSLRTICVVCWFYFLVRKVSERQRFVYLG